MQRVSSHIIACMLGKARTGMSFGMCTSLLTLEVRAAQQARSIAADVVPGHRDRGAEKCKLLRSPNYETSNSYCCTRLFEQALF